MSTSQKTVPALAVATRNPRTETTLRKLLDGEFYAIYVDLGRRALQVLDRGAADLVILDLADQRAESAVVIGGLIRTQHPTIPIIGVVDPRETSSQVMHDIPNAFTFGMTGLVTLGQDDLIDVLRRHTSSVGSSGYVGLFQQELDAIPDEQVQAFCRYLLTHPHRKHTIETVARALEMHAGNWRHLFERLHMPTPGWLIRRSAMLAAATLITERKWSAAAASETLGYKNGDTLRRALRRHAALAKDGKGMERVLELCTVEIREGLGASRKLRARRVLSGTV